LLHNICGRQISRITVLCEKTRREESVERTDSNDDGVAGPVPESARSADETTSSDATLDPRVAREDVDNAGTNGLPANDPAAGEERKRAYERGAILVSRID
jgi:hypothetical protein